MAQPTILLKIVTPNKKDKQQHQYQGSRQRNTFYDACSL